MASITSELRLFAADPYTCWVPTEKQQRELRDIADRIDAEHRAALEKLAASVGEDHDGWVELPKDADGEVIHVGDMMERGKARGHVIALMLSEYPKKWGGELHWGVQLEGEQAPTALDAFFRHYHEPTVEDVLRELLFEAEHFHSLEEEREAIAEYAAKLRLAGVSDA